MNTFNKESFDSFNQEYFQAFIERLEEQGYIIDGQSEDGYSFSSTQLDNMTEEVFSALIDKFDINTDINHLEDISKIGCYHPENGGYSMIFNNKLIDYSTAKKILDEYTNSF